MSTALAIPDYQEPMSETERKFRYNQAMAIDPVRFAKDCGFKPDPWQVQFLQSGSKHKFLNCSRQVGKSTIVAYRALHRAIYSPGSLILLLSPGERQSAELMKKVQDVYHHVKMPPPLYSEGSLQMLFMNGSRILALPGKDATIRGYSAVDVLVVDEASQVADSLFFAIEPMLAVSGGELLTLSSPYGTRGWWYGQRKQMIMDAKEGRKNRWDYYEVPAPMCPRITPEFLEAQRYSMGDWWWKQEYFCVFLDAQSAAFSEHDIDNAFSEDVMTWTLPRPDVEVDQYLDGSLWTPGAM